MECLRDYIGVIGCGAITPIANEYINDLPGISLESIESIADDEQKTFVGVWENVQDRALKKFAIEVNERFAKRFKIKQIRSIANLLKRIDENSTTAAANENRGFSVELTTKNSSFVASTLQLIYVEELSVFVIDKTLFSSDLVLKITDLETGDELDSFSIAQSDIVDGWNKKRVGKYYDANRIACTYNSTSTSSVFQNINTLDLNGFYSVVNTLYGAYCDPLVRGVKYTDIDNPTFGSNTFGMTGVFGVACKFDNLVCSNKDPFLYPLKYLLGAEIMIETLYSSRTNFWTTIGKEDANTLYKEFYAEFSRSLDQIIDTISISDDDACLVCNEQFRYVTTQQ